MPPSGPRSGTARSRSTFTVARLLAAAVVSLGFASPVLAQLEASYERAMRLVHSRELVISPNATWAVEGQNYTYPDGALTAGTLDIGATNSRTKRTNYAMAIANRYTQLTQWNTDSPWVNGASQPTYLTPTDLVPGWSSYLSDIQASSGTVSDAQHVLVCAQFIDAVCAGVTQMRATVYSPTPSYTAQGWHKSGTSSLTSDWVSPGCSGDDDPNFVANMCASARSSSGSLVSDGPWFSSGASLSNFKRSESYQIHGGTPGSQRGVDYFYGTGDVRIDISSFDGVVDVFVSFENTVGPNFNHNVNPNSLPFPVPPPPSGVTVTQNPPEIFFKLGSITGPANPARFATDNHAYATTGVAPHGVCTYQGVGWTAKSVKFVYRPNFSREDSAAGSGGLNSTPLNTSTGLGTIAIGDVDLPPCGAASASDAKVDQPDAPASDTPVDLAGGHKVETVTDLEIPLAGRTAKFERTYSSDPGYTGDSGGNAFGRGWTPSFGRYLRLAPNSSSYTTLTLEGYPQSRQTVFTDVSPVSAPRTKFSTGGPTPQYITRDPNVSATQWILHSDGAWTWTFETPSGTSYPTIARLTKEKDAFGNETVYTYDDPHGHVSRIDYYNGTATLGAPSAARLAVQWQTLASSSRCVIKKLDLRRFDAANSKWVTTQTVRYYYANSGATPLTSGSLSTDVGTTDDLIQVTRSTLVDFAPGGSAAPMWDEVTQYRYYGNTRATADGAFTGDPRLSTAGQSHQLKAIIQPAEIERYAAATTGTVADAANALLQKNDGAALSSPYAANMVLDLAAKVVGYYDSGSSAGKTRWEYIQGGCGCSGSAAGLRKEISYIVNGNDTAVKTIETILSGGTWTAYRTTYQDLTTIGGSPMLVQTTKVDDQTSLMRTWAFRYNTSAGGVAGGGVGNLRLKISPGAIASYTPATTTQAASITLKSTAEGRVEVYSYTTENRRTDERIAAANDISLGSFGNSSEPGTLVTRTVYGASGQANERPHLAKTLKRYRSTSVSDESQIETTEFRYAFRDETSDVLTAVMTIGERESSSELGLGDSVAGDTRPVSVELFNQIGQNTWSCSSAGMMTGRKFDSTTGVVTKTVKNVDPSGTDDKDFRFYTADFPGVASMVEASVSGSADSRFAGTFSQGKSFTVTSTVDLLGRTTSLTTPGGVAAFGDRGTGIITFYRKAVLPLGTSGFPYLCDVTLPHKLDASWNRFSGSADFAGVATVSWKAADGVILQTSSYVPQPVGTYSGDSPNNGIYSWTTSGGGAVVMLGDEIGRTARVRSLTGMVTESKEWQWLNRTNDPPVAIASTLYTYDGAGRLIQTQAPSMTAVRTDFDGFDRPVHTYQMVSGVSSGWQLASDYFYDDVGGWNDAPVQGNGDGLLTRAREYTGSSAYRQTMSVYDARGRRLRVIGPFASSAPSFTVPDQVSFYDNQSRVIEASVVARTSVPSSTELAGFRTSEALTGSGNTTVGAISRFRYSQRGLLYQTLVGVNFTGAAGTTSLSSRSSADYGDLLTSNWYDVAGRPVASRSPGAAAVKSVFDGLSRITRTLSTTSGPTTGQTTSMDTIPTGEYVIEQSDILIAPYTGRQYLTTNRQRHPGTAAAQVLSGSNALTSYSGTTYDDASRPIRTIDFGTTSSSGVPAADNPPAPSAPVDISATVSYPGISSTQLYGPRGLVIRTTSGREFAASATPGASGSTAGVASTVRYDDRGQAVATAANVTGSDPLASLHWDDTNKRWYFSSGTIWSGDDDNIVSSTVYDVAGRVIKRISHQKDFSTGTPKFSETEYLYAIGTLSPAPDAQSNEWVREIHFPDPSSGAASSTSTLRVSNIYNRAGELVGMTDQRSVGHTYLRDAAGRMVKDTATIPSGGTYPVDGTVQALEWLYDEFGRLSQANSIGDAFTGVVNSVGVTYTSLWQPKLVLQKADGALGDPDATTFNGTRAVRYEYDTSSGSANNYSRLSKMVYPDRKRVVEVGYSGFTTPDYKISRVQSLTLRQRRSGYIATTAAISYDDSSQVPIASYLYAGKNLPVEMELADTGYRLDRSYNSATAEVADSYPAFDRFGRVVRQPWITKAAYRVGVTPGDGTPPLVELAYTYDSLGRVVSKNDARPGATWDKRDWQMQVDGLGRLTRAEEGRLNGSSWYSFFVDTAIYGLDHAGNWRTVSRPQSQGSSTNTVLQTRYHDLSNQMTASPGPSSTQNYFYDLAGSLSLHNTTKSWLKRQYSYDAWNRLVRVYDYNANDDPRDWPENPIVKYAYNALNWRTERVTFSPYNNSMGRRTRYYYDLGWRLLQEDVWDQEEFAWTSNPDEPPGASTYLSHIYQQYWGVVPEQALGRSFYTMQSNGQVLSQPVLGTDSNVFWQMTEANNSVCATMRSTSMANEGRVYSRATYSPYGIARHHWGLDTDGDGAVTSADEKAISTHIDAHSSGRYIGQQYYVAEYDVDGNGEVNSDDVTVFSSTPYANSLPDGVIDDYSTGSTGPRNSTGYAGYVAADEFGAWLARNRYFSPSLGRWINRDPAGYVSGLNLYEYCQGVPQGTTDPSGLDPVRRNYWTWEDVQGFPQQEQERIMLAQVAAARAAQAESEVSLSLGTTRVSRTLNNFLIAGGRLAVQTGYLAYDLVRMTADSGYQPVGDMARNAVNQAEAGKSYGDIFWSFEKDAQGSIWTLGAKDIWEANARALATGNWDEAQQTAGGFIWGYGFGKMLPAAGRSVRNGFRPVRAPCPNPSAAAATRAAVAARQAAMLNSNTGYNISPSSWWARFAAIGRDYTYMTDAAALRQMGLRAGNGVYEVGLFDDINMVSWQRAAAIEQGMGLNRGSLLNGFRVSEIQGIRSMSPMPPTSGNAFFRGPGLGLPNGAPELVVPPITTNTWPVSGH